MLVISTINCRSLRENGRIEELERLLLTNRVDVCLLQETGLKRNHDHTMVEYVMHREDRLGRRGGTAIAVRKNLAARVVRIQQLVRFVNLEGIGVVLNVGRGTNLFCPSF